MFCMRKVYLALPTGMAMGWGRLGRASRPAWFCLLLHPRPALPNVKIFLTPWGPAKPYLTL